jgi:hypothetical protein
MPPNSTTGKAKSSSSTDSTSTVTVPPDETRFEIKIPSFELRVPADNNAFDWRAPMEKTLKRTAQAAFDDLSDLLKATDVKKAKEMRDKAKAIAKSVAFLGELVIDLGDCLEKGGGHCDADGGSNLLSKIIDNDDIDPQNLEEELETEKDSEPTPTTSSDKKEQQRWHPLPNPHMPRVSGEVKRICHNCAIRGIDRDKCDAYLMSCLVCIKERRICGGPIFEPNTLYSAIVTT